MAAKAQVYRDVLADNIAAGRRRMRLSQASLAARMAALGFPWIRQTVSDVEQGRRRVLAEEIVGLGHALEATVYQLVLPDPRGDKHVILPTGRAVLVPTEEDPDFLMWDGNQPGDRTVSETLHEMAHAEDQEL